jgi:hypothetical protein
MTRKSADIARELAEIRALGTKLRDLGAELINRTSRLEEEPAPIQGKAPRKGRAKPDIVQTAINKRNKRILR